MSVSLIWNENNNDHEAFTDDLDEYHAVDCTVKNITIIVEILKYWLLNILEME